MEKSTVLTDPDGVIVDVAPIPQGAPYAEDAVAIYTEGGTTAWVSAAELIEAIEEAAGITKPTFGHVHVNVTGATDPRALAGDTAFALRGAADPAPAPEPLWTEVRERPARAVKVTPELVRTLADSGQAEGDLSPLQSVFDGHTGEPFGVTWYDFRRMVDVTAEANGNTYVILRQRQVPEMLGEKEFELMYEEVA